MQILGLLFALAPQGLPLDQRTLAVEVVDPDGEPVPGVPVLLRSRLDDAPREEEPRIGIGWQPAVTRIRTSTGVDGRALLPHARDAVERSARADPPQTETRWWLELGPAASVFLPLDPALADSVLHFVLPRSAGARSDPGASFVVRGRFVGVGRVRLPVPLEVYDVAEDVGVGVPPGVLDAPPGTLSVGNRTTGRPRQTIRTPLARDGAFAIEVPPGILAPVIVFEQDRYGDRTRGAVIDLSTALRGDLELGDVPLRPSPILAAGQIVDAEGRPVRCALVSPHEESGGMRTALRGRVRSRGPLDELTDGEGRFEIRTLAPLRTFDLHAEGGEGEMATLCDVAWGTRDLRLVLVAPGGASRSR